MIYKPQPKPSEQDRTGEHAAPPAPVFCKDCRHYRPTFIGPFAAFVHPQRCIAKTRVDPVLGVVEDPANPKERNATLNCALFEPKKPWWRLW